MPDLFGPTALARFVNVAHGIERDMGNVRAIVIFDSKGDGIGVVSSFTRFRDDLAQTAARACGEVHVNKDGKYTDAAFVGLIATDQRDPSGGYAPASETLSKFRAQFAKQGLSVIYWVETWKDEVRIPDEIVSLHLEQSA